MIYYFGTDLTSAGHFFFGVVEDRLLSKYALDSVPSFKDLPFDPEELTNPENGSYLSKGDTRWYRIEGWTICAIVGSCIDRRGGCKSVFFTKEKFTFGEFAVKLSSIPIVKKMIKQMPFQVKWGMRQEILDQINNNLTLEAHQSQSDQKMGI